MDVALFLLKTQGKYYSPLPPSGDQIALAVVTLGPGPVAFFIEIVSVAVESFAVTIVLARVIVVMRSALSTAGIQMLPVLLYRALVSII